VNSSEELEDDVPPDVATVTGTVPLPAGEVALSDVELTTLTSVAATLPKSTVAPVEKPVPETVTDVPPATGPELGLIELTVGAMT
jgi:hypothetical protein